LGGNVDDIVVCDDVCIVCEVGFGMIFDVIAVDVNADYKVHCKIYEMTHSVILKI